MINRFLEWFHGYIYIVVSGENISRFLNICSARNFQFNTIEYRETNVIIRIRIKDYYKLHHIVRKCKIKVHIKRKCGLPFWINRYKKRQMMFLGILSSFVLMYILSLFVWQITVEGNYSYSDEEILDYIEKLGITHGIKKDKIDGESLEKALRNEYFDITWVSSELIGTRLVLHIKENFDQIPLEDSEHSGGTSKDNDDVISKEDGIVAKMITRKGTALVDEGDVIKPGDVLIKGQYDIVNDAGEIVETKYTKGDGTIYIYAKYEFYSELPMTYKEKKYINEYNDYTVALGDIIIDLSFFKKENENEDKIYDVSQFKITENYYLPIYLYENNHKEYELIDAVYSKEDCERIMNERFQYFFENLSEKSIQIVENNVTIEFNDNMCISKGDIVVLKEIE